MSTIITDESHTFYIRNRISDLADNMLKGDIEFLEGAIELASLHAEAKIEERDPDFEVFSAIASETAGLPIGKSKQHWSNAALAKHQILLDEITIWAKRIGIPACESLVRRFTSPQNKKTQGINL